MSDITLFFASLRRDIAQARTKRALKLLERRGRNYLKNVSSPMIKKNVKKRAQREYKKSLILIKKKNRRLK